MASPYPNFRSQFGDTTYTKVFVGGLAWETETEEMHRYFEQFGEILEAVIIKDKTTGKSKGYGFVTFRDPESARRACENSNPIIDGRRANCNIAALGRPRPSPPRGRMQGNRPYPAGGAPSYTGVPRPLHPPLPPPPMIYPPYGYTNYGPDYGYPQALYNPQIQQPQYYQQMYRSSSSSMTTPYYYGYSLPSPRGAFPQGHRVGVAGPSYLYYPSQIEGYPDQSANPFYSTSTRPQPPQSTDSQTPRSTSTDARVAASESPNT